MAFIESVRSISVPASSALQALGEDAVQFTGVIVDANGDADHPAALGDPTIGVVMNGLTNTGDPLEVAYSGRAKIQVGAAITAGDRLTVGTDGIAVVGLATQAGLGIAMSSGVAGDVVDVLLVSQGVG